MKILNSKPFTAILGLSIVLFSAPAIADGFTDFERQLHRSDAGRTTGRATPTQNPRSHQKSYDSYFGVTVPSTVQSAPIQQAQPAVQPSMTAIETGNKITTSPIAPGVTLTETTVTTTYQPALQYELETYTRAGTIAGDFAPSITRDNILGALGNLPINVIETRIMPRSQNALITGFITPRYNIEDDSTDYWIDSLSIPNYEKHNIRTANYAIAYGTGATVLVLGGMITLQNGHLYPTQDCLKNTTCVIIYKTLLGRIGSDIFLNEETEITRTPDNIDPESAEHILDGNESGTSGGHRSGTGNRGKTEFPPDWTDQDILDALSEIAKNGDTSDTRMPHRQGDTVKTGHVKGVEIDVVVKPDGKIRTGFPIRGSGVIQNPR